mgnify:CR=1 FL=1
MAENKEIIEKTANDFVKLPDDCKFFVIGYMTAMHQLREKSEPKKSA